MKIFKKGDYICRLDGIVKGEVKDTFADNLRGCQCIVLEDENGFYEDGLAYDSEEFKKLK
ncbi:hypothetical protein [Clostridium botulinum]|uniref:hypothetical protein n=1 Tax=Clostridium botulinum TaxID=1491 RepID=UPI0003118EC6|nr:hypothetical protein [Clostridium botulinum]MBD5563697.1 hypothetical protein [Clostridium botulinum]MBD5568425.1 hypothetical protein [Clostridium botulinum]MBD5572111.1 hypothetical protein [Clostridium botulinum]MBD5579266.1 hypothetical protein [Clostridium botulinum]MBD5612123.1 hypothetical protein [Clostridium botulinum]